MSIYVVYAYDLGAEEEYEFFLDLTEDEAEAIDARLTAIAQAPVPEGEPFIGDYGVTLLRPETRDIRFDEWITGLETDVADYLKEKDGATVPAGD